MDYRVYRVLGFRFAATRIVVDLSAADLSAEDRIVPAGQIEVADPSVAADQIEVTRCAVETSAPNVAQNAAETSVLIVAPNEALTAVPSAVQVRAAAFRFLARCVAQNVAHGVRISVQFAAERAEFPLVSQDVVLVVGLHDHVPASHPDLEFPDAVAPPVVPLSVPVDSRAVQASCVESSEFVDLSRVALHPPAFSVVLLAEALQFAVPDVRQLPLVQFAEAQALLLPA